MCKYCEGEIPLHHKVFGNGRSDYSEIGCSNGFYYICNSIETDEYEYGFEFDISYCPMCGRRLGDD